MRFIPTLLHGAADYLVGLTVIGLPFYQGWVGSQRASFVVLGTFVIIYSLFSDYKAGLIRFLRLRFHLLLDGVFGVAMLSTPWLLDLPAGSRTPVYTIGFLALLLVMTTKVRAQCTHSQAIT